jgi:hypothetical protein
MRQRHPQGEDEDRLRLVGTSIAVAVEALIVLQAHFTFHVEFFLRRAEDFAGERLRICHCRAGTKGDLEFLLEDGHEVLEKFKSMKLPRA